MNRFSLTNNFGWTLFVLIFAAFWSAANVESAASSNVAKNVRAASDSSAVQNAGRTPNVDQPPRFDAAPSSDATVVFERSRRGAAGRAPESERLQRFEKSNVGSSFPTSNPRAFERDGFAVVYRSFWACQAVSRPLFLLLQTLRN